MRSVAGKLRLDAYRVGYQLYGGNEWPVAVASASSEGGNTPLTVTFDSTGSTDRDGRIVSYLWAFGDGATSTSTNPQHTYTVPGKYVVTLNVTDDICVATTNTVSLDVTAPNLAPVAKFVVTPPSDPAPLSVVLTSDESYDPDGAIGNREWKFSDGGTYFGDTAYQYLYEPWNLHSDINGLRRSRRPGQQRPDGDRVLIFAARFIVSSRDHGRRRRLHFRASWP